MCQVVGQPRFSRVIMREDAASASTLVIPARARRQPQHRHPGESRDPYRGWAIFQSMAHTDAWPCSNARYASRARTRSCMRYVSGGIASLNRRLPAGTPAGVLGSCRPRPPQRPSSRANPSTGSGRKRAGPIPRPGDIPTLHRIQPVVPPLPPVFGRVDLRLNEKTHENQLFCELDGSFCGLRLNGASRPG